MRKLKIGLITLIVLALSGCTMLATSLESEGYGVKVSATCAGFTTEASFDPAKIFSEKETK